MKNKISKCNDETKKENIQISIFIIPICVVAILGIYDFHIVENLNDFVLMIYFIVAQFANYIVSLRLDEWLQDDECTYEFCEENEYNSSSLFENNDPIQIFY